MGYCVNQLDADFKIKRENFGKVISAVKDLLSKEKQLGWVTVSNVLQACKKKDIEGMFSELGFNIVIDDALEGDIEGIMFTGEKLGEEEKILNSIAKYVEDGSFIEMQGEDGGMWRWIFKNGKMKDVSAKIVYEDED